MGTMTFPEQVAERAGTTPATGDEASMFPSLLTETGYVLTLPSALTLAEALKFEQRVKTICDGSPELNRLILDFSQTRFIDSSGLGALIICHRLTQASNKELILRRTQSQVKMALEMTDLAELFTFEDDPEALVLETPAAATTQIPMHTHPSVVSQSKRALDILGALVGLCITGVLFLPIAIAIKLEDGGPIFFSQVRCSWMGKRFRIYKFRSMVMNAEALKSQVENQVEGPLFKNAHDPRITPIGRFLRKTSLDELPQFWNVLKGDMSLVGTRPPTPDEIEQYKIPEWQRLNVKPGMTGEWQVNGRSSVKSFEDVIQMDLTYQKNWSLLYDIKLIIKTIFVVFSRRSGAA